MTAEPSAPSAIKTAWGTAVLATLCALRVAAAEPQVVAVVNGAPITDTVVNQVVKSLIVARGSTPSSDEIAQLSDAALASLIDLELLYGANEGKQQEMQSPELQQPHEDLTIRGTVKHNF